MAPRRAGLALLAAVVLVTAAAPLVATHDPATQFSNYVLAPPMWPRLVDATGAWRGPFVYPIRLENRLARVYRSTDPVRSRCDGFAPESC